MNNTKKLVYLNAYCSIRSSLKFFRTRYEFEGQGGQCRTAGGKGARLWAQWLFLRAGSSPKAPLGLQFTLAELNSLN